MHGAADLVTAATIVVLLFAWRAASCQARAYRPQRAASTHMDCLPALQVAYHTLPTSVLGEQYCKRRLLQQARWVFLLGDWRWQHPVVGAINIPRLFLSIGLLRHDPGVGTSAMRAWLDDMLAALAIFASFAHCAIILPSRMHV